MKKVLLLGDSIMYGNRGIPGYGYFVKHALLSLDIEATLPTDNCQDSRYTFSCLEDLIGATEQFDVIHWNNGLWDCLHFAGNPRAYTPVGQYGDTLLWTIEKLHTLYPKALIVFA